MTRDAEGLLAIAQMGRDHYREMWQFQLDQAHGMGKLIWTICTEIGVPVRDPATQSTAERTGDPYYFGMWNERDILAAIRERCTSPASSASSLGRPSRMEELRSERRMWQETAIRERETALRLLGAATTRLDSQLASLSRRMRLPMAHRMTRWERAKRWLLEPTGSRSGRTTPR